jgi:hypothetical protein
MCLAVSRNPFSILCLKFSNVKGKMPNPVEDAISLIPIAPDKEDETVRLNNVFSI